MRSTALIALNVFRESVRDKVLYNLVAFAILLIGASYMIGQLTAGQDVKIIKDLGLSATSIFGLFLKRPPLRKASYATRNVQHISLPSGHASVGVGH